MARIPGGIIVDAEIVIPEGEAAEASIDSREALESADAPESAETPDLPDLETQPETDDE